MLALLSTLLASPTQVSSSTPKAFNSGTVRPPEEGTYELMCGGYSRFCNGHWRRIHNTVEAAANEEQLATFALPPMRHLEQHRWRPVAKKS